MRKVKERLLFILDNMEELETFPFSNYIPDNAKKVEVISRENKGERILEIDYILELSSKEITQEVNKNG